MGYSRIMRHCPHCRANTYQHRKDVNHLLHALITLFGCGLWLPVWICLILTTDPWHCESCEDSRPTPFGATPQNQGQEHFCIQCGCEGIKTTEFGREIAICPKCSARV
jgi:hypothetical protein